MLLGEVIFVVIVTNTLAFILGTVTAMLSSRKADIRKHEELNRLWGKYYEESRKFKKMDSVVISYANGEEETVEEVRHYSADEDTDYIYFYDRYEKVIKIVKKFHVVGVTVNRTDEYVDGKRRLDDEY